MTNAGEQGENGSASAPPEVTLQIDDSVPPEHRDAIKASVATLARRSAEASRTAFERRKARNQLRNAIARPLRKLIEGDADASEALAAATRRTQDRSDQFTQHPEFPIVTVKVVERLSEAAGESGFADQVFGLPFHFQWEWFDGETPVASEVDRITGRVALETVVDDNHRWSNVHGGFGVHVTSDTTKTVVGRSLRRTNYAYNVKTDWPSGDAFAEGGTEMTAFEDGILFPHPPSDKRFRAKLSNGDDAEDHWPSWTLGEPIEVEFVMRPGRGYTFNVGAWVECSADGGEARARIHADLMPLTTFLAE